MKNPPQTSPTPTEKKTLQRKLAINVSAWVFPCLLLVLVSFEILSLWFLAFFFLFWLLDLLPKRYFLTKDYVQREKAKLLLTELQDVRVFCYWLILIDVHGESIWIPHVFLKPEDKAALLEWLGIRSIETPNGKS